jgi:hypothetical protein
MTGALPFARVARLTAMAMLVLHLSQVEAQESVGPCTMGPDDASVEGVVTDRETRMPLWGVRVVMAWQTPSDREVRSREMTTDVAGRFAFCAAPVGTPVRVMAEISGDLDRAPLITLEPGRSLHLLLGLRAPHLRIRGRVIEAQSGEPVSAALISLGDGILAAESGTAGGFVFEKLPPGSFPLQVQRLGYAEINDTLDVALDASTFVTIRMDIDAIPLDAVVVEVRLRQLEEVGFYDRMARGHGDYLVREDIDAALPLLSTDVLRRVAGLRMESRRTGPGYTVTARAGCPMRFFVNGAKAGVDFDIDDIPPDWIEALEIYRGAASIPGQFALMASDLGARCGVIAIWTRNRITSR